MSDNQGPSKPAIGEFNRSADHSSGEHFENPSGVAMQHRPVVPFYAGPGQERVHAIPTNIISLIPQDASAYAIIDAGLVPNLPEMIEASGLPHCCLFRLAEQPELAASAPWLVQLDDQSRFVRGLFTRGSAPWHLWDSGAFILLFTAGEIAEVGKTLRRFTRVRDNKQRWYYWRFWEVRSLLAFLAEAEFSPLANEFVQSLARLSQPVRLILPDGDAVTVVDCTVRGRSTGTDDQAAPQLTDIDRQCLRTELRRRDALALGQFLRTLPVIGASEPGYLDDLALRALIKRDQLDIRSPNGIAWMVILLFLSDRHPRAARLMPKLVSSRTWSFDQIARLLRHRASRDGKGE